MMSSGRFCTVNIRMGFDSENSALDTARQDQMFEHFTFHRRARQGPPDRFTMIRSNYDKYPQVEVAGMDDQCWSGWAKVMASALQPTATRRW